jgi:type IV pilus assembly protein PilY1
VRVLGGIAWLGVAAALAVIWSMAWSAAAFDPADGPVGWVARPAASPARAGTPAVLFRADYRAGLWTGTVKAQALGTNMSVGAGVPWPADTATQLDAADWSTERRIITCSEVDSSNACTAAAFRWDSLGTTQRNHLGDALSGPQILAYLRGDRSNEAPQGAKLRPRASVQGDILHSPLTYWRYPDGTQRLFVGGNDGMLHVFDAATGAEVYAYVPSMLTATLPRLARSPYSHTPYVDGGLDLAEVTLDGSTRTLLVGALGGGGKGLFMLDITRASSPATESELVAEAPVKWEVTASSAGFGNLGYTYAAPRLARLNNGQAAVVVGNGYLSGGGGRSSLMLLDARSGAMIREIEVTAAGTGGPGGLSTATLVDTDRDGKVDVAYAGDLDGRLWRFDLTGGNPSEYRAKLLGTSVDNQPITTAPAVTVHPGGGRLVVFGSGSTLSQASLTDSSTHWLVGLWDGAPADRTRWLEQSIVESGSGGSRMRVASAQVPDWGAGGHRGWRLALPAGERVVAEGLLIVDGRLHVTTTNPTIDRAAEEDRGSNWFMELLALTGGSPPNAIFDLDGNGGVGAEDMPGGAVVVGRWLGTGVASQPAVLDSASLTRTLFNLQSDNPYLPTSMQVGPGVSGGHFDADFYASNGTPFKKVHHVHEYDDKFDVNGMNMLAPSDDKMRLSSQLGSATPFKVLVSNQYLNPASLLKVGANASFVPVRDFGGQAAATDPQALLDSLPVYALEAGAQGTKPVTQLVWKVPLDAFQARDWWGDGGPVRAGLIPSQTDCVHDVDSNGNNTNATGKTSSGERHNGALTIQLIAASTPATALRRSRTGDGDMRYGWTVREGNLFSTYVLAEYTFFWHHDNKLCYGQANWNPAPAQDPSSSARSESRAAGSADPADGSFGGNQAGASSSVVTRVVSGVVTTTITYTDGSTKTIRYIDRGDGTESVTTTSGQVVSTRTRAASGQALAGLPQSRRPSARVNWREIVSR